MSQTNGSASPIGAETGAGTDIASTVAQQLPYLRRYARALTGSQDTGDRYAEAALMAILEDRSTWDAALPPKAALFRVFNTIWASSGSPVEEGESGLRARAQMHLRRLTPNTREALLLHTIEEFGYDDIGAIMGIPSSEARDFVQIAEREMQDSVSGKVLVIEDEAIIAMDIQSIVAEMGHAITGVARTRAMAVEVGRRERPDLILADIQLADNSSGIDAVNDLLKHFGDIPVIFITAFPERLLTGDKPEPAFLISKPYTEEQVRSSVSQAMFFASTETLHAQA
jgi:DNA-directed RNA polymerase specialized sigma24 family protein